MSFNNLRVVPMVSIFALGACSFASDTLFPPVENGNTELVAEEKIEVVNTAPQEQVYLAPVNYEPNSYGVENRNSYLEFNPQRSLKTVPGEKVAQLRTELHQLHGTIDRHTDSLAVMRNKIAEDATGLKSRSSEMKDYMRKFRI